MNVYLDLYVKFDESGISLLTNVPIGPGLRSNINASINCIILICICSQSPWLVLQHVNILINPNPPVYTYFHVIMFHALSTFLWRHSLSDPGFESGTRAAAAGGITTVIDMPINNLPAATTGAILGAKIKAAQACTAISSLASNQSIET